MVESCAQISLVISAIKNHLRLIRWRFIGPFKTTKCLETFVNDPIRSAGLIVEIVDIPFRRHYTAFRMTNTAPSVLIKGYVWKTVRSVLKRHAPLMKACPLRGLPKMPLCHEKYSFNPIKRSSLIVWYVIIRIQQRRITIIIEMDHVPIVQIISSVRTIVPLVFKSHLPRILKFSAGVQPIP